MTSNQPSAAPLLFVRSLLCNPLRVGAVAPSSPRLSRLMASCVQPGETPVLEVGAGTGAITRELIERGIHPRRLLLIERDPSLAAFLRRQFPEARVRCGEALDCHQILRSAAMGRVGSIVSSLPLRNLSAQQQVRMVAAMMSALTRNGQLIQFTYSPGCPIPASSLGLHAECLGRVWRNLPPAAVWRFTFDSERSWETVGRLAL